MPKEIRYEGIRPEGVKPEVWERLVIAWENGLSDREAAFFVSQKQGLYLKESDIKKWIAENPDVGELRDYLQSYLLVEAKMNLKESLEKGDISTSKWYLERKKADEFSTKSAVAFEGAVVELSIEDKKRKMDEFLKDIGKDE